MKILCVRIISLPCVDKHPAFMIMEWSGEEEEEGEKEKELFVVDVVVIAPFQLRFKNEHLSHALALWLTLTMCHILISGETIIFLSFYTFIYLFTLQHSLSYTINCFPCSFSSIFASHTT